jgi:hypothetical protein
MKSQARCAFREDKACRHTGDGKVGGRGSPPSNRRRTKTMTVKGKDHAITGAAVPIHKFFELI